MLHKINPRMYPDFIPLASSHPCGKVYPCSIAEGICEGEIFTNVRENYSSVLFWSHSGFAYLLGQFDEYFLEDIYALLLNKNNASVRRFLLMTNDELIRDYFKLNQNISIEKRYLFEYADNCKIEEVTLPIGYQLKEIDNTILLQMQGNIVPSLFWKDPNAFLDKGKGYCITCNNEIAAWAFSAAVSSEEVDIGIETSPMYRQQGLGIIVAEKMIEYTIKQGKKPVWACHYKNAASERMAEKLGFVKISECSVIKSNS